MARGPIAVALLSLGVLCTASCSSPLDTFRCEQNLECQSESQEDGVCEPNGLCSFSDPDCGPDGRRFGNASGGLSNECVGANAGEGDGGGDDQVDAGRADALVNNPDADPDAPDAAPDATPLCTASPTLLTSPGAFSYTMPSGCGRLTIEAYGAGGGGAELSANDSGAGGGGGSGAHLDNDGAPVVIIGAGGGGGGSTDDVGASTGGGGGGGGGYAKATFEVAPGTALTLFVGGGGADTDLLPLSVGGEGGAPGGGAGGGTNGNNEDGADASTPWGGGGGGGDNGNGGNSVFGGAGGAEEDGDGGDSMYGGAGAGGFCGSSDTGTDCDGYGGGGGGYFISNTGNAQFSAVGDPGSDVQGGDAAQSGSGTGGQGGTEPTTGGNGALLVTPKT